MHRGGGGAADACREARRAAVHARRRAALGGAPDRAAPCAPDPQSDVLRFFDSGPALRNATTFVFEDNDAGYRAGYLSGLVEASHASRLNEQHVVSMIGGLRGVPSVEALLAGFAKGVHKALPDATVLRNYSQEFADTSPCEAIANRQIDAGSDIVFAAAGRCSLGALSAASIRRVWAVGVDSDQYVPWRPCARLDREAL